MKPTLGRVVLFQTPSDTAPGGKVEVAGMIVKVMPGALAESKPDAEIAYVVRIRVFNPDDLDDELRTPTSFDPAGVLPNSWCWPPRV